MGSAVEDADAPGPADLVVADGVVAESPQDFSQNDPHLDPGKVGAEAAVAAHAEGCTATRLSQDRP